MVAPSRVAAFACVMLWAVAVGAQAPAQDEAADTPQAARARLAFEHGLQLLRDRQWREAETEFRASIATLPRASAQYDLAFVVFKQGRLRESVTLLQQLLSADPARSDPRYRESATALLSEALSGLGVLHLTLAPASAEVRIDGEFVAIDGAERSVPVDPGPHRIEVSAPGFVPSQVDFDAVARVETPRAITLLVAPLPRAQLAPGPAAPSMPAPDVQRPWLARYAPWLTAGAGAALLISALVVGSFAQSADDEFSQLCPAHRDCDPGLKPKRDRIARLGLISDVLLASGVVVTAGGLAWALLIDAPHAEPRSASIALAARGDF